MCGKRKNIGLASRKFFSKPKHQAVDVLKTPIQLLFITPDYMENPQYFRIMALQTSEHQYTVE